MRYTISIHNFAFFAKQRCHVLAVKFVQTRLEYVEDAHTHVYRFVKLHFELHLERSSIATSRFFAKKTL